MDPMGVGGTVRTINYPIAAAGTLGASDLAVSADGAIVAVARWATTAIPGESVVDVVWSRHATGASAPSAEQSVAASAATTDVAIARSGAQWMLAARSDAGIFVRRVCPPDSVR
jgi:hypothetical protein